MANPPRPQPSFAIIAALGLTQIIGFGTLYYAFAIQVPGIAADLGVPDTLLFTLMSVGLLLGGIAAPFLGKTMDRIGAGYVMAFGSGASGLLLGLLALSPSVVFFGVVLLALELIAPSVLYGAAFATLTQINPARARRAITQLTLFGGFASSIFWPVTGGLLTVMDWRGVYFVYAGLHLLVGLPLHYLIARHHRQRSGAPAPETTIVPDPFPPLPQPLHRRGFWLFAISVALSGLLMAGINFHFVPILVATGLGTSAYLVSMVMGPAQVLARLTEAVFWQRYHPLTVAIISALALPLSIAILFIEAPAWVTGVAFAVCFGTGQGLSSIILGTVPLALFGPVNYGQRQGQIAMIRVVLSAAAPAVFAIVAAALGLNTALIMMAVIGAIAAIPLIILHANMRGARPAP